jgi:signal transduction histidine kinase
VGEFPAVLTVLFVYGLLTAATTVLTTGIVRLLQRLADMRRSFLHLVLHDLRSPVGTAVTMLEGLSGGVDGDLGVSRAWSRFTVRANAFVVKKATMRVTHLVVDLFLRGLLVSFVPVCLS